MAETGSDEKSSSTATTDGKTANGEPTGDLPKPSANVTTASRRFQQTQAQVDEVVGIMRTNVERVLERDSKLSELDDRADALNQGASLFEQQAGKLKRKYWWQNLKMLALMIIVLIVLVLIFSELFS